MKHKRQDGAQPRGREGKVEKAWALENVSQIDRSQPVPASGSSRSWKVPWLVTA